MPLWKPGTTIHWIAEEHILTVTIRKQQQKARSNLTFATVGSKPITSTHTWTFASGQTLSSHREGRRSRGEMGFGSATCWFWNSASSLPTFQSLLTFPSHRAFPDTSTRIPTYLLVSFFIIVIAKRKKKSKQKEYTHISFALKSLRT